jgi:hypothetical protein
MSQKSGILVLRSVYSNKFVLICAGGTAVLHSKERHDCRTLSHTKITHKPIYLINNEMNIFTAIIIHCIVRTGNGISCSLYSWEVGVTDHFTAKQFSNFWHGKGTFYLCLAFWSGPGSIVGIATGYGLDNPGIESWWGRDFLHVQTGPGAHPASCTMGTRSFLRVKSGWGVTLTLHPLLVPWSWKGRAILLLPLWAVRPVQSLSVCTRVHFTFCILRTDTTHTHTHILWQSD